MLKVLEENKIVDWETIGTKIQGFEKVVVDLGTGNGKFAYDLALKEPNTLVIGIDPVADNLFEYWKKARKNIYRRGKGNLFFVISSIEALTEDLNGIANIVYVNFPWGTLLEGVVKGDEIMMRKIARLGKIGAKLQFSFSYSSIHEPEEIRRRGLPLLSLNYMEIALRKAYARAGIAIESIAEKDGADFKNFGTYWSKILFLGKSRNIYTLDCRILEEVL